MRWRVAGDNDDHLTNRLNAPKHLIQKLQLDSGLDLQLEHQCGSELIPPTQSQPGCLDYTYWSSAHLWVFLLLHLQQQGICGSRTQPCNLQISSLCFLLSCKSIAALCSIVMRHVYSTVIMNTEPNVLYNLMIVLAKACLSVSQPPSVALRA